MSWYTLVICSDQHHSVLKRSMDSIIAISLSTKPRETIIIAESAEKPEFLKTEWPYYESHFGKIRWAENADIADEMVQTDNILLWKAEWIAPIGEPVYLRSK